MHLGGTPPLFSLTGMPIGGHIPDSVLSAFCDESDDFGNPEHLLPWRHLKEQPGLTAIMQPQNNLVIFDQALSFSDDEV